MTDEGSERSEAALCNASSLVANCPYALSIACRLRCCDCSAWRGWLSCCMMAFSTTPKSIWLKPLNVMGDPISNSLKPRWPVRLREPHARFRPDRPPAASLGPLNPCGWRPSNDQLRELPKQGQ